MPDEFDPYLHWLGIRDPQRPPNHYRLLGVELFESDPEVISNAADRQMAHVRTFQAGRRSAESQKVLNELAAAKVCLLNPQKKPAYDSQLQLELAGAGPPQPFSLSDLADTAVPALPPSLPSSGTRKLWGVPITVLVLGAVGVVLAALVVVLVSGGFSGDDALDVAEQGGHAAGQPAESAADTINPTGPGIEAKLKPDKAAQAGPGKQPDVGQAAKPAFDSPKRRGPPPKPGSRGAGQLEAEPGKDGKSAAMPAKSPGTDAKSEPKSPPETLPPAPKSIKAARAAMKQRQLAEAKQHLDRAEKAAFPRDREQLDRLHDVFDPWEAFWNAVRLGLSECKQGETLRAGEASAEVVRATENELVVRIEGGERKYALQDLPAPLALAIADKKLPANVASLSKAAFLTVDARGDPQQAMKLCQQSAERGVPPSTGLTSELKAAMRATGAPPEHVPDTPPPPRLAVPDTVAQQAERKNVRDVYKARFAQARTPAERGILADDLLRDAKETKDNPVARFVLLAEARDLAITGGDPARLREIVLEMAKLYEVNPLEEQTRALVEASESALPSVVRASLAKGAIGLAREAIQADAYDAAAQLAKAGFSFASKVMASKGRDPHTIRQASELGELIPWYKEQHDLAQQAEKALSQDPNNSKAVLFLGKYYALVKDRWDRGLPLLAKGEDPTLKALAEAEQSTRRSNAPPEMVKLADQWMDAVPSMDEVLQRSARQRALYWYEAALPRLSGLTKERVARAIDTLKQTDAPRRK